MEKKLIASSVREKKDFLHNYNINTMRAIRNDNVSWSMPKLDVDGLYNKTKAKKLETQLLSNKTKQEIITMDKEELLEACKSYWKNELTQAIKRIDELSLET